MSFLFTLVPWQDDCDGLASYTLRKIQQIVLMIIISLKPYELTVWDYSGNCPGHWAI